jgi:hypothetical protein
MQRTTNWSNAELRAKIDACGDLTSFKDGWKQVEGRCPNVQCLCGMIGSVFPNTATVESDLIGYKKTDARIALSDFSLNGILHAKQYKKIMGLRTRMDKETVQ